MSGRSFLGGLQTRPFILYPTRLPVPERPIVGAAPVQELLNSWRLTLQTGLRGEA